MAVSPTVLARVGSGYGERTSSRTGQRTFHAGWDFVAPRGEPIYAADTGEVRIVAHDRLGGPYRGYGNAVVMYHPEDQTYVLYAHLATVTVREGDRVTAGTQIGTSGNTTNGAFPSMPPHLHLEVRQPSAGGGSPFPGAYGRLNLDPKDWFARRGLVIGNRSGNPPGTLVPGGTRTISGLPAIFGGAAARSSTPPCPHGWMGGPCLVCLERGLGRVPEWWETTFPPPRPPEGTPYVPAMEGNLFWDFAPAIAGAVLFNAAILLSLAWRASRSCGWSRRFNFFRSRRCRRRQCFFGVAWPCSQVPRWDGGCEVDNDPFGLPSLWRSADLRPGYGPRGSRHLGVLEGAPTGSPEVARSASPTRHPADRLPWADRALGRSGVVR